jgi:hypothetical protein
MGRREIGDPDGEVARLDAPLAAPGYTAEARSFRASLSAAHEVIPSFGKIW